MLKRIKIVGTSGSGKTTLARQIAAKLKIQQIELDALFWDANWTHPTDNEFRQRVEDAMQAAGASWVMDGNYSKVSDISLEQADTLIWLDYPLRLVYWRIITRTIKRVVTGERLWSNNRESLITSFFSKDSVIWWAHTTYHRRKQQYSEMMQSNAYPHLTFIRFTTPQQVNDWLNSFPDVS